MLKQPSNWETKIQRRIQENSIRELKNLSGLKDFYSNDYIGNSRDPKIRNSIISAVSALNNDVQNGATGSRLLSGNHDWAVRCEHFIREYYFAEEALLFNSGYDANMGIMGCIADRNDTIIYDELSHASIRDGLRISTSRSFSFKHNDIPDLEKKLQQATGNIFVITESIFSMDGDASPLKAISELCDKYKAYLMVDEAHAVGMYGNKGEGLVHELGLNDNVYIRIITFGKGVGYHGAAALCSSETKQYLVNFCRSLIYSTALPPLDCIGIIKAHESMQNKNNEREQLKSNSTYIRNLISQYQIKTIQGNSAIVPVIIPDNLKVKQIAKILNDSGIGVFPVVSPTVPIGSERLRIIVHAYNTREEMDQLTTILNKHYHG